MPRPRRFSPLAFFFFTGDVSLRTGPPLPLLEWHPFPPLVAAVLITPKGAESPGNGHIGVIVALLVFSHLRPFRIFFTFLAGPLAH